MNHGRSVFAQLVELLPRRAFENAVSRYGGDRRLRTLSCMDQLLCMIFAQLTGRSSLRETVSCLNALGPRRYHCGIRSRVARSTLAEANEKRDFRIFMDTAMVMIAAARIELPVDKSLSHFDGNVYALDSTTVDLCLKLFPWAQFRRRKAGIKAHMMLDVRVGIPVFLRVTAARTHDVWALDQIAPQAGAYYVMDKAYIDFARLHRLHCAGAFFITRAKKNMAFGVRERRIVDATAGIVSDRIIRLRGPKSRRLYPDTLRLIRFIDPQTGRRLKSPDQQFHAARSHDRAALSQAMADRTVLQMDQTASAYQGLFRQHAQRREDATVDRSHRVPADRKIKPSPPVDSGRERNVPNPKRHDSRKNACFRAVFGDSSMRRRRGRL